MSDDEPGPDGHREDGSLSSLTSGTRWLTISAVTVGAVNYGYALALTRVLPPTGFAIYGASQALLLSAGTVASASVPWVMAQGIVKARNPLERRRVVLFGVVLNLFLGVVTGTVAAALGWDIGGREIAVALFVTTILIMLASTPVGWLQGERRFRTTAVLRILEVLVKVAVGFGLVLAGGGAAAALSGFAWGAAVVVVIGVYLARRDFRVVSGAFKMVSLWRSAAGIGAVQVLVSIFSAADVVLVAILPVSAGGAGSYQAVIVLSRVPLFLGAAIAMAAFPLLARGGRSIADIIRLAYRLYILLAGGYAVALATLPTEIASHLFPSAYNQVGELLLPLALAGVTLGLVNVVTTFYQSLGLYRQSLRMQLIGLAVHAVALVAGFMLGGVLGLAIGSAVGSAATAGFLVIRAGRIWQVRFPGVIPVALIGVLGLLLVARVEIFLWLACGVVVAGVVVRSLVLSRPSASPAAEESDFSDR